MTDFARYENGLCCARADSRSQLLHPRTLQPLTVMVVDVRSPFCCYIFVGARSPRCPSS